MFYSTNKGIYNIKTTYQVVNTHYQRKANYPIVATPKQPEKRMMIIKNKQGRPSIDPLYQATIPRKITPYQHKQLVELGYPSGEQSALVRQLLDDFIKANGGSTYERK